MILNLKGDEERAYRDVLFGAYEKQIRVELLDRTGDIIEDLTRSFQDGSVTIDTSQDVNRAASIQVLDPKHRFGFDADTYYGADLDLSRLIRASWVTESEKLARPVSSGLILGPVTGLNREGVLVTCEVQSMEALLLRRARRTLSIKRGRRITGALRDMADVYLPDWVHVSIPDLPRRLSEDVTVHPKQQPWRMMLKLAEALNRHLFFDRNGVLRLTPYSDKTVWTWSADVNGNGGLISDMTTSADLAEVKNIVHVEGRIPKGGAGGGGSDGGSSEAGSHHKKKKPVSFTAVAPADHQFSVGKIGVQKLTVTNRHLRTDADCRELAERLLDDRLSLSRDVQYDVAPVPDLDELDIVAAVDDHESVRHRLRSATIPLGTSDTMQVGYTGPYRRRRKKRKGRA
jgi:hypothetical protein